MSHDIHLTALENEAGPTVHDFLSKGWNLNRIPSADNHLIHGGRCYQFVGSIGHWNLTHKGSHIMHQPTEVRGGPWSGQLCYLTLLANSRYSVECGCPHKTFSHTRIV